MSCRKKMGWRGPRRSPLSEAAITGDCRESGGDAACCAWGPVPPNVRRAAMPPAATPPTTKASLRIIISLVRKTQALPSAKCAPKYSPHYSLHNPNALHNPTFSVGFGRLSTTTTVKTGSPAGNRTLGQPLGFSASQVEKGLDRASVVQLQPTPLHRPGTLRLNQSA